MRRKCINCSCLFSCPDSSINRTLFSHFLHKKFPYCYSAKISSKILVEELSKLEDQPWGDWRHGKPITQNALAQLLKPFGIRSKTVRDGDKTAKGYMFDQFTDAFKRYATRRNSPSSSIQSVTTSQSFTDEAFSGFQSVTQEDDVTVEKRQRTPSRGQS